MPFAFPWRHKACAKIHAYMSNHMFIEIGNMLQKDTQRMINMNPDPQCVYYTRTMCSLQGCMFGKIEMPFDRKLSIVGITLEFWFLR